MKRIPNFSSYYITKTGEIFSTKPYRNNSKNCWNLIKAHPDKDGYLKVILCNDAGERKDKRVHVLVAETYLENPEGFPWVLHKDGGVDAKLENLYWGTPKQNSEDSRKHGTWQHGEKVNTCKLKVGQVKAILKQDQANVKELALQYGVSIATIYKIRSREIWKTVEP